MPQQKSNVLGSALGNAAFNFLTDIVDAKRNGEELPKALDKIATLAIKGQSKAIDLAKVTAKEKAKEFIPWYIVGGLVLLVIILLIYKR